MKTTKILIRIFLLMASVCLATSGRAQTVGTITGRVLNPATGEYIRNAEVRVEGSPQVAISEDGGYYRLTSAPVGEVVITAPILDTPRPRHV